MTRLHALAAMGLATCLLCACGGGGGDDGSSTDTEVPASVGESPEAYTRYAASLVRTETGEPLGLDQVPQAPVSETDEPLDLP